MPPKVRDLIAELERAGFANRGGKEATETLSTQMLKTPVTISGKLGDDAKHYQVRAVGLALEELKK